MGDSVYIHINDSVHIFVSVQIAVPRMGMHQYRPTGLSAVLVCKLW